MNQTMKYWKQAVAGALCLLTLAAAPDRVEAEQCRSRKAHLNFHWATAPSG